MDYIKLSRGKTHNILKLSGGWTFTICHSSLSSMKEYTYLILRELCSSYQVVELYLCNNWAWSRLAALNISFFVNIVSFETKIPQYDWNDQLAYAWRENIKQRLEHIDLKGLLRWIGLQLVIWNLIEPHGTTAAVLLHLYIILITALCTLELISRNAETT